MSARTRNSFWARITGRESRCRRPRRRRAGLQVELLESRTLLAADFGFGAPLVAMDVNTDGSITPLDVLSLIGDLNQQTGISIGEGVLQKTGNPRVTGDVNRDGGLTSLDVLSVIRGLNQRGSGPISLHDVIGNHANRISDAQRENLQKLFSDLNAIREDSEVTPEQITQLVGDVATLLDGATLPSEESVSQLLEDFHAAAEDGQFSPLELVQLSGDVDALLESADVSREEVQAVVADLLAIVEASGVTQEDFQSIADDLRAIVEEFHNNHGMTEAQRENVHKLATDAVTIASESQVTPAHIEQLRSDVAALADGAEKPDPATVVQLVHDVRAARSDGQIDDNERELLAADVDAVLESANIPQEERESVLADIAAIVEASGVTQEDLQVIAEDLRAIRDEFLENFGLRR